MVYFSIFCAISPQLYTFFTWKVSSTAIYKCSLFPWCNEIFQTLECELFITDQDVITSACIPIGKIELAKTCLVYCMKWTAILDTLYQKTMLISDINQVVHQKNSHQICIFMVFSVSLDVQIWQCGGGRIWRPDFIQCIRKIINISRK